MWEPIDTCPHCGSSNLRMGSPYQDDYEAEERDGIPAESWECLNCGCGGGGANYWK